MSNDPGKADPHPDRTDIVPIVPPSDSGKARDQADLRTDWFLQYLVSLVRNSPMEFGITLQVSGMLVSGQLVSHKTYFEGLAIALSEGLEKFPDLADTFKTGIPSFGVTPANIESNVDIPMPQFIHLKNAKLINTAGHDIPRGAGVWWRGRISEVGGFILGTFSESS